MSSAADLPDDIAALKAIILAEQKLAAVHTGVIARKEDRIVRLEKLVADFKRALFGAKSEKVCPEQFELALEDIVPAQFRVIVTRHPKYACRSCEGGITQAPAPAHLIAGGMPTEVTVAHVIVSKDADHLPLYCESACKIDPLRWVMSE